MEILEGKRMGSKYFVQHDYVYRLKWKKGETSYLCCTEKHCPGKATYKEGNALVKVTKDHIHQANSSDVEVLRFKEDLNKRVVKSTDSIKKIYYEVAEGHQSAAQNVGFVSAETRMRRKRRTKCPPIPRDLCNLRDYLVSDDWKELGFSRLEHGAFFRCLLQAGDGSEVMVFISPTVSEHLTSTKTLHIDGTFKIVPLKLGITQLTTIHVTYLNKAYAAVYALMTSRTHAAYCMLLEYVKSCFPEMDPKESMSDFEIAERSSLTVVFTNIRTRGCWFHYAQAVWLKHKTLGLFHLCGNNIDANKILKTIMALPLLPAEKMLEGFDSIKLQIRVKNFNDDFSLFIQYIEGYWLTEVGVETLSVYGCPQRTNNDVESFHMQLLLQANNQPHPSVWNFIKILTEVDRNESLRFMTHRNGKQNSCTKSKAYVLQEKRIREAEFRLQAGVYSVQDFIEATYHSTSNLERQLRGVRNIGLPNPN